MANIQTRTTEDNRVMHTARIRIKGYPQQTATFSRLTDAKQWAQKTEAKIREGIHFSQAEAKRHTFADMVERYIKTVLTNKSAKIQYQYAQQLRKWCSFLGDLTLDKITPALIAEQRENFKQRMEAGETLHDILPEAFAAVREAGQRALGLRIFDVQMIGGITLHEGRIAEMRTGEGKTLVATLPLYLNALSGDGVHLVTVNDYLAKWGAEWMGPVYRALGMTVGVVYAGQVLDEKRAAYQADITYGTNNEVGFDLVKREATGC